MSGELNYSGPERRNVPPLSDEELQWVHEKIAQEKAMGRIARLVRTWGVVILTAAGVYAVFKDWITAIVRTP